MRILFVCTANICRSPMAEVLLREWLRVHDVDGVEVASAGRLWDDVPAADGSRLAMAGRGLDLASHRSTLVTPDVATAADLLVGMAREHVRETVRVVPEVFDRTFTLKELVRRGERVGLRGDLPLGVWLAAVGEGRKPSDLLGASADDDVADPIGGPDEGFERAATEIEDLVRRLGLLLFPA